MTTHELAFGLGYLGAALGVAMVVPQIVRIVRHPSLPGVSPLSWALTGLSCLLWLTYGLRTGALPQIPGNVLLVCGAVAVVLLVKTPTSRGRRTTTTSRGRRTTTTSRGRRTTTTSRGRRTAMLVVAAALLELVACVISPQSVGYLAFAIGTVSTWPQLYDSFGNWRAHLNSGVSLSTWGLRIASQVCWISYAVGTSDMPVGIGGCVALLTAVAMVALETAARAPTFAPTGVLTETA